MKPHGQKSLRFASAFLLAGVVLAPGALRADTTSAVLATVGERSITEAEIENQIKGQMLRLNNQIYSLKKQAVDSIINAHLQEQEAKKRGITRQQLRQREVTDKTEPVSDVEVADYYTKNKTRFGEKKLEEVQARLKQSLQARKQQQRQQAFAAELRKVATINFKLTPPIVDVPTAGAPAKGPRDAPITLVEFSDYQ